MLNRTTYIAIEQALNNGYFRPEDFVVSELPGYSPKITDLKISYQYNCDYWLTAKFDTDKRTTEESVTTVTTLLTGGGHRIRKSEPVITGDMKPGGFSVQEDFEAKSLEGFLSILGGWLKQIRAETNAEPQWREAATWRKSVEEFLDKELADLKAEPGETFTPEEVQALKERLDRVESELTEKLKDAIKDQEVLKKQTADLHATVEFLKGHIVGKQDKPTTLKAITLRLIGWCLVPENRPVLKGVVEVAKFVAETTHKLLSP